ncbi:hypothetical protein FF1_030855 [Malus domestica]|uniref:Uncharacterized protein n=1 Tax=Malus domestica TaxID=3750 RepID=A0A498KC30_MALDO|nr:hypothetical protein DVH24_003110 [Malus domestica]
MKSTSLSLPMQLCMTLTRSVSRPATQAAFTWAGSTDARCSATGVAVTWPKVTPTAYAKGASSAGVAWRKRWVGPAGDVKAPGLGHAKWGRDRVPRKPPKRNKC